MAEEDLVLRASLKDDISRPIDKVVDRVEDLGDAAEDTGKSAKEMGRQADSAGKSAKEMGRQVDSAGKSAARTESRLSKLAKGGLSRVQKYAKRAAFGVAAIGTGILATVGTKGISRLLNIEDAQAKLKGLGHSSRSIGKIMKASLKSVQGTAFGLDEAANTAASAVAAGIKPGKELTRYLENTADAAALADVSMGDMGRTLNKAATLGAAYNDTLQVLAEKGLPVYGWLSKELGVSTAEVKKLASEGKITSEVLQDVIGKNTRSKNGDRAALAAGDTTRGAARNVLASAGRIGAGALGGVFGNLKTGMQGLTELMGPIETKAQKLGDTLGSKLAKIDLVGMWKKAKPYLTSARDWFTELWASVQPVGPALKEFGNAYGPVLITILGGIVAAGAPVVDWLLNSIGPAIVTVLGYLTDNKDAVLTFVAIAGGAYALSVAVAKGKAAIMAFKAGMLALNLVMAANPVAILVIALAALAAGAVWAYQNVDWFRDACDKAWALLKYLGAWIKTVFVAWLTVMGAAWLTVGIVALKAVRVMVNGVLGYFGMLLAGAEKAFGWIPGIGGKIKGANKAFQSMREKVDDSLGAVENKLKGTRDKVIEFGKTNVKVPKLNLDTSQATSALESLQRKIRATNGKTITINSVIGSSGDTATSRAAGGRRSHALQRTVSAHNRINQSLGGRYMVSNALIGGGGNGRGSGDHQAGRALDVVGRNLPAYAQAVRESGGYAAIHGTGGDKHVHAVMGDTATSRRPSGGGAGGGSRMVVVQAGAIQITVVDGDPAAVKAAVRGALEDLERELEEADA